MARGKKTEKVLTAEEKLEQNIISKMDEPFSIPENWQWVRLGCLGYTNIGLTYKPSDKSENGTIVLRSSNIKDGHINYEDIVRVDIDIPESKMSKKGDILICARNGSKSLVGKAAIIDKDGMSYGAFMAIFRSPYNRLIYYYLGSHYFRNIIDREVGTTTINQVTQQLIKELPFPLSPLGEQQRIVDRIERLFAKLDEAKEKAQTVVDGFETRRAAILHKAYTGELTKKWRLKHNVDLSNWRTMNLQEVCLMKITDGTHKTPIYCDAEKGIPFLSAKDVTSGEICWDNIKYIIPELHEELYVRLAPKRDDILLAKNGTTGVAAIVDTDAIFDLYVTLAVLRPNKDVVVPQYLLQIINSPLCKNQFDEHLTGIGVPNLHLRDIKNVQIVVPTIEEQYEIAAIIDGFLFKERYIKEIVEVVLQQVETMKKSILARAFRGELGTNDPSEKSAVEVMKNILSL